MSGYYNSENEIHDIVRGFEECTTGKDSFSHRSHLTVGAIYLQTTTPAEAFEKMRDGLLRFLNHHQVGTSVYSDEITQRWLDEIRKVISEMNASASMLEITNAVIARLADKRLERFGAREKPEA
jgi:hypothetical protein